VRESAIEKAVNVWARDNGLRPLKLSVMGENGWPDRLYLFTYPSIAFIEFKAPGGKPRPLQEARIAELRGRGYPVGVFDDVYSAIAFLEASCFPRAGGQAGG
jgi:VRR-NUC domain